MPNRKNKRLSIEEIAQMRDDMIDLYAELYSSGLRNQHIIAKMQARWPQYSARTIVEYIKPIAPVKKQVDNGIWVSNKVRSEQALAGI